MDVKEAKFILKNSTSPSPQVMEQNAYCNGFLDAIDQLKATGIKETLEKICNYNEPAIAMIFRAQDALAKLNALLGEPLEGPKDGAQ